MRDTRPRIVRLFGTLYRFLSLSHSISEPSVTERSRPTSLRFRREVRREASRGEARRQIHELRRVTPRNLSPSQHGDSSVRRQQYAAHSTLPSIAIHENERIAARRLIEMRATISRARARDTSNWAIESRACASGMPACASMMCAFFNITTLATVQSGDFDFERIFQFIIFFKSTRFLKWILFHKFIYVNIFMYIFYVYIYFFSFNFLLGSFKNSN